MDRSIAKTLPNSNDKIPSYKLISTLNTTEKGQRPGTNATTLPTINEKNPSYKFISILLIKMLQEMGTYVCPGSNIPRRVGVVAYYFPSSSHVQLSTSPETWLGRTFVRATWTHISMTLLRTVIRKQIWHQKQHTYSSTIKMYQGIWYQ